ncbi:MAG TPA: hypothetical protein GXX48_01075 [Ochrobactrum intermedium]|uniref:Uncharacterized protein n=1 Tax=Brucella intermedia TaxID=94625 RepID=A0A7V6P8F5_9HYPH|nr:hypothetical protein [Brucella intermedia]HHV66228.1 hypothetical protein [Brucella intermedia]
MENQLVDKPTLINRALVLHLGESAIYSIDAEDDLSGSCDAAWDATIAHCFGLHDWTFARRTQKLDRLADRPENGWAYGFALPGDRIGPPQKLLRSIQPETPLRDYTLEAGNVYANEPSVWGRCKVLVDPEYWPIDWRVAFVIALGAALAKPVSEDGDLEQTLRVEAFGTPSQEGTGGAFGRLIAQDRAAAPMPRSPWSDDPLTSARWG